MASAIIVFSHLRWESVYQRPQQILSRLAQHYPILFVEEPLYHEAGAFLKTSSPASNIVVCQPHTPVNMPGFHDDHLPYLQKMMRQLVRDYDDHMAWLYTPMALPLLQELHPRLVVYDCIAEFAAFRSAPRQLAQRESAVLKLADIVFGGGRSLYRSRCERHPNVHCFPSSVDAAHFLPALDRANSHPAHREIPGPRLGFYGVIDERLDTELIARVSDAHPMWQIVLVGPVVNIDPAGLPQRSNIHYLGQQPYQALPHFLAGWDVCLLPYAVNESTRSLNPVKILEYMAAELPIVSTPVPDVVEGYSDIVAIAPDSGAFIAACEAALLAAPEEHEKRVAKMRELLAHTSWDSTVGKMRELLDKTPPRQADSSLLPAEPVAAAINVNRLRPQEAVRYATSLVIGAGPTGLSAAYHLGHDAVLLEKNSMVGGRCRSIRDGGFTFDYASHIMFSNDPYVLELVDILLGSNVHWQNREAWLYSKGAYLRYPFPSVIEANDGRTARGRTPPSSDVRFAYPLRGGLQALMSAFVPHVKGTIELNADVIQLAPKQRTAVLADGRRYEYENLISTMPLPELVKLVGDEAPQEVKLAALALRHTSVRYVSLGVARENITDKHWIYFPEDTVFQRIFAQGNASPECNAAGGFGLTCEIGYSPEWKPLPASGQELVERCVRDCIRVGLLTGDDRILAVNEVDMPYAHVVNDEARAANLETVTTWFSRHDIVLAGRCGEWEYGNADHAFIAGKTAAETVLAAQSWVAPMKSASAD